MVLLPQPPAPICKQKPVSLHAPTTELNFSYLDFIAVLQLAQLAGG